MRRVALLLVLAGCVGGAPPPVTPLDVSRAQAQFGASVQIVDLEHGRSLLVSKCSGCHAAPLPIQHVSGDWPHALDEMAERSNLDREQRVAIERYLVTLASR